MSSQQPVNKQLTHPLLLSNNHPSTCTHARGADRIEQSTRHAVTCHKLRSAPGTAHVVTRAKRALSPAQATACTNATPPQHRALHQCPQHEAARPCNHEQHSHSPDMHNQLKYAVSGKTIAASVWAIWHHMCMHACWPAHSSLEAPPMCRTPLHACWNRSCHTSVLHVCTMTATITQGLLWYKLP